MPRLKNSVQITCALMLTLGLFAPASADITIGSWNLKHLGWDNGKRVDLVAEIAQGADLWALEEVMDAEALQALERRLEQRTDEAWSSLASHAVGRSSYTESYAFLWRDSAVEYTQGAVVYLDPGDLFAREPYLAEFRDKESGDTVAIAAVHIVYGDSRTDRTPEIRELASIWDWMSEVYPDSARLIVGDFNLPPADRAWQPLRDAGAQPAITTGATTLSNSDGQYASLYDNFWYDAVALQVTGAGVVRFPQLLGIDHQTARDIVSDHAPIYLTTGDANPGFGETNDTVTVTGSSDGKDSHCIDLNTARASELDRLPNVGPARAQSIIDGRPWVNVDALTRINGIGSARAVEIQQSGLVCGR
ncbi:MAG: helix-hairpin-helix domain-containing protein [Pseudomonadota bacterium]|nr:helix-hairpin-helix domain-containing protein [Pseudomonadota bacterium]